MRKLSEIKGEEAMDVLADLMEPVSAMLTDKEVKKAWESNMSVGNFVSMLMKKYKNEMLDILVIVSGESRKKYLASASVISIVQDAMDVMSDPPMQEVFIGQGRNAQEESSGSVAENTKAQKK